MTYQRVQKPVPKNAPAASRGSRFGPDRPAFPQPDAERDDLPEEAEPETASRLAFDFSRIPVHRSPPRRTEHNAPSQPPLRRETENRTGMPGPLKAGLERMSGVDLSSVRVHYGSARPRKLNAAAYAQGDEIHLGPGQESFLPHEAWHVVQQRQGRVQPTGRVDGVAVNKDRALEHEAETLGTRALYGPVPAASHGPLPLLPRGPATPPGGAVAQLGKLLDAKNLKTREETLSYLQTSNDSKRKKEDLQKEWNKEHPQEIITRPEWVSGPVAPSQNVEVSAEGGPLVAAETNVNPEDLVQEEEKKPLESDFDFEDYLKKNSTVYKPQKTIKKKKRAPKETPSKGDRYNGPLSRIGRHHLPLGHKDRAKREGKLEHGRRASTTTVFTDDGYNIALNIIKSHGRSLKVLKAKPGGDVLVVDEDSGLQLGVHTDGTVYPLATNKGGLIEKD